MSRRTNRYWPPWITLTLVFGVPFVVLLAIAHFIAPAVGRQLDEGLAPDGASGKHESRHFTVYAPTQASAVRAAMQLETLTEQLIRHFASVGVEVRALPESSYAVYVLRGKADLANVGMADTANEFENNGGYFNPNHDRIALIGQRTFPDPGLTHELVHLLMSRAEVANVGRLSPWASEGLAQVYEFWDPVLRAIHPDALRPQPSAMSLEQILQAGQGAFSGVDNSSFYAAARSLVSFLLTGGGGRYRERFWKLVREDLHGAATWGDVFGPLGSAVTQQVNRDWVQWQNGG